MQSPGITEKNSARGSPGNLIPWPQTARVASPAPTPGRTLIEAVATRDVPLLSQAMCGGNTVTSRTIVFFSKRLYVHLFVHTLQAIVDEEVICGLHGPTTV